MAPSRLVVSLCPAFCLLLGACNQAPTANAGADQTVMRDSTVTLDGGGSRDSEGGPLTYQWSQIEGSNVAFSDPSSAVTTFVAPAEETSLVFELWVQDPVGATDTDRIQVQVRAEALGSGFVTFRAIDGHVYRIAAKEGATAEDITEGLDALSPREPDDWLNISPDGEWLLLSTERFDPECSGWSCLAVVSGDLSDGGVVRTAGQVVRAEGFAAIASGGNLIVYSANGGANSLDLWVVTREADDWSVPRILTGDSPFAFNSQPAISDEGDRVVFDCGDMPDGQEGTAICEVSTNGSGFTVVLTTADNPPSVSGGGALHHPDYDRLGGVIFEADWDGERVWRFSAGTDAAALIAADVNNDNSPCVLGDGRIASLWLDRQGGPGTHEIKVANSDGEGFFILFTGEDVVDTGIGCSAGGFATDNGNGNDGQYFPAESVWYEDISEARLDSQSDEIIAWLESAGGWGGGRMQIDFTIEVLTADETTPFHSFVPTDDWFEPDCDLDDVPLPPGGALEGEGGYRCTTDGDCHLIVVHPSANRLYEMWRANIVDGSFLGGCLVVWDLTRVYDPEGRGENCTSADAAGFPIAPLLFSADEVAAGSIDHAIRFILPNERIRADEYVHPATHSTSAASGPAEAPPYGARLRLRPDFPVASLPNDAARTVARALQKHGMLLADAGTIVLTAQSDRFTVAKWDDLLGPHDLELLQVDDFEVVDGGERIPYTGDCER